MTKFDVLLLLHILSVCCLIGGILGRTIVLGMAARAAEIREVQTLVAAGGIFEQKMVIPGSFAVLLSGLGLAWVEDQPLLGFLQGSGSNWLLASLLLYLSAIPLIVFIFIPRGKHFGAALEEAGRQGAVTPRLRAAFGDRAVELGHAAEFVIIFLVLVLMVGKAI
jgi:hypothetical protein